MKSKQKQLEELIIVTAQTVKNLERLKSFYEHNGFDPDPMNCVVCKIDSLISDFLRDDKKLKQYKSQRQARSAEE